MDNSLFFSQHSGKEVNECVVPRCDRCLQKCDKSNGIIGVFLKATWFILKLKKLLFLGRPNKLYKHSMLTRVATSVKVSGTLSDLSSASATS